MSSRSQEPSSFKPKTIVRLIFTKPCKSTKGEAVVENGWISLKLLLPIVFCDYSCDKLYLLPPTWTTSFFGQIPYSTHWFCLSSGFHHMTSLEFSLPASFLFVFCQHDSNVPRELCEPSVDIPRNTYQKQNSNSDSWCWCLLPSRALP